MSKKAIFKLLILVIACLVVLWANMDRQSKSEMSPYDDKKFMEIQNYQADLRRELT